MKVKEGWTHNDALAFSSSAQLSVSWVLHIHNPTAHKHSKPCEKEILYSNIGQATLRERKQKININPGLWTLTQSMLKINTNPDWTRCQVFTYNLLLCQISKQKKRLKQHSCQYMSHSKLTTLHTQINTTINSERTTYLLTTSQWVMKWVQPQSDNT